NIGRKRRLIAVRRRDAAQQRRYLRARLREAEDVIDEEQDVLTLFVAEILGESQAGQADAGPRAGRLVHLAVDERRLRALAIQVDDPGLHHLVIKVVALAGALADTGEHRVAAMRLG